VFRTEKRGLRRMLPAMRQIGGSVPAGHCEM
jgi:hypothetical protein